MQKKIIIVGANGRLGSSCCSYFAELGWEVMPFSRAECNLAFPDQIDAAFEGLEFDVLVNTSGMTDVDLCESEQGLAQTVNSTAAGKLAEICKSRGAKMVQISTDYVFDGCDNQPITEQTEPVPISIYGRTKLNGEKEVLSRNPDAIVIRISWLFGPNKPAFPEWVIEKAINNSEVKVVSDKWSIPTSTIDLCEWIHALLERENTRGLFHLSNSGVCSWAEYGQETLDIAIENGVELQCSTIELISMADITAFAAQRPQYSALDTKKFEERTGIAPRSWQEALEEHLINYFESQFGKNRAP